MKDRYDKGVDAAERIRQAIDDCEQPDLEDVIEVVDLLIGKDDKPWVPDEEDER